MPKQELPVPTAYTATSAISADGSEEGLVTALYRLAIGPVNTAYYLGRFTRFEAAQRADPGWNWAACLCTLNWLLFRQMWGAAWCYAAVLGCALWLAYGVVGLGLRFGGTLDAGPWLTLVVTGFFLPGVFGNAWLHAHSRKKMARALSSTASLPEACAMLSRQASSRQRLIWLALANAALAGAATGAWLSLSKSVALPTGVLQAGQAHTPVPDSATGPGVRPAAGAVGANSLPQQPAASAPPPASAASVATAAASAAGAATVVAPARAGSASGAGTTGRSITAGAAPKPTPPAASPAPGAIASKSKPAASVGGVYINVGLFAEDGNARRAHARLLDAGLPALTEEIETGKGRRTRVRSGPFDTRAQAQAAAVKIRALGLEAVLLPP